VIGPLSRREFTAALLAAGACAATPRRTVRARPVVLAVQSGDPGPDRAIVWARCDRRAQLVVEWSVGDRFPSSTRVEGPMVGPETDGTGIVALTSLPPGRTIHYRVSFVDGTARSEPVRGRLRTPSPAGHVWFAWSGDIAGQGWGIDEARGGMRGFEAIRRLAPDFFLCSGDQVYADNPLLPEVRLADGTVWRNLVTGAKAKVAETLFEHRGQHAYNFLDANVRRLAAEVPLVAQWDDHDVRNNWYPGQRLDGDDRYREKRIDPIAAHARQAFFEWNPLPRSGRIHRRVSFGPRLDLFVLDARTFRGPNGANDEAAPGTPLLGPEQLAWLLGELAVSRATWKIIASDLPIGLMVPDGAAFESWGNGAGPPRGREHEIAALLTALLRRGENNVLFLTADVHYAAAHRYHPSRASFGPFAPFWELVAGPLHAGCFAPLPLDPTFGPEVVFQRATSPDRQNLPPSGGLQSFGAIRIDGRSGELVASLRGIDGSVWWEQAIAPGQSRR
jgi:alkaline phosphatase D